MDQPSSQVGADLSYMQMIEGWEGNQPDQEGMSAAYPTDSILDAAHVSVAMQSVPRLVSGAGHDALAMSDLTKARPICQTNKSLLCWDSFVHALASLPSAWPS